jgi:hypothetical protein
MGLIEIPQEALESFPGENWPFWVVPGSGIAAAGFLAHLRGILESDPTGFWSRPKEWTVSK